LQNLQGVVIPQVHGYYNIWGLLKLLALEVVGTAIPEDAPLDAEMRMQMKSALSRIHSAGYVHGDIARRNFCKRGKRIFLVDLETLAGGSTVEMEDELAAVDAL
jgi:tRNA A-37 threonylcarbamoyl transferase component Bud32